MPNNVPPRWPAWSKSLQPISRPVRSTARRPISAFWALKGNIGRKIIAIWESGFRTHTKLNKPSIAALAPNEIESDARRIFRMILANEPNIPVKKVIYRY